MKIQLMSDTHLETYPIWTNEEQEYRDDVFAVNPEADVVVLAGDIVDRTAWPRLSFVHWTNTYNKPVIWVPGNHEYWGGNWTTTINDLKEFCKKWPHITILDTEWKEIDGVTFIGATLWAEAKDPLLDMSTKLYGDFAEIAGLTQVNQQRSRFYEQCTFLNSCLREFKDKKTVVVTHHLPSWSCIPQRYSNELLSGFYASNLDEYLCDPDIHPDVWLHGHTHQYSMKTIGETLVVTNAVGTRNAKNPFYKPQFIFEV